MAAAGCELHEDLTKLAVMWFARVLLNIHKFWNLASRADRYFRHQRPDAVVLIDYPGFNWWIARRAKAHGIPVFYYGAPQLWAWAGWRIKKMRRFVDHVLCKLPFEEAWYRERGCNATFVGHPYFDQLRAEKLDAAFIAAAAIAERAAGGDSARLADPGSEEQLRLLLEGGANRFTSACRTCGLPWRRSSPARPRWFAAQIAGCGLPIEVHVGRTAELIHAADCAMAVSGSVSLELLYHTTPTVILYHISRLAFFVQRFFRKVRYITLVNLLTTDDLFPKRVADVRSERPGRRRRADARVSHLRGQIASRWPATSSNGSPIRPSGPLASAQLAELKERVGHGGASRRAADYMLERLGRPPPPALRTHYPFGDRLAEAVRGAA